jgi:iron complex transport system ATP-binding protein
MSTERADQCAASLAVSSLSLAIGGAVILSDVTFSVPRGEFLSIVGPNGAGKSTLLRCLMGVATGWSGEIAIDGKPFNSFRRRDLARFLSYVPQSDGMWFPFTGRQLVMMGRYPYLSPFFPPGRKDREVVEEVLRSTGTLSLADRDIRTLSGGERQKILIAGALAQEAGTMLLDEPTTFLDPRHTDEVLGLLENLNGRGVTVVMVTHDINQAAVHADRVAAMVGGRMAFSGTPLDFMDNEILEAVYGKRFTLGKHPLTGRKMVFPEGARK